MKDTESITKIFEKSDEALLIIEDNTLKKWNEAANKMLNGSDFTNKESFSLTRFSPPLQPDGQESSKYEKELTDKATHQGYCHFEWILDIQGQNVFPVEVSLFVQNNGNSRVSHIILRHLNEDNKLLQLLAKQQIEIDRKTREIKNQEDEIELQKELIETQRDVALKQRDEISYQKKDITDSIQYAKRIQHALLPKNETFKNIFSDCFVLYQPKDIVSGDFYWISNINNKIIVAAADCTGHGVPGAFMSMMGIISLNEIVNNMGIIQPNKILNSLKNRVISSLGQNGKSGEAHDGMDIAIITVDYNNYTLQYSGAFIPLVIVRNNQLIELKSNRMPVGFVKDENVPFTNHEIQIFANDSIYLFSDGYADQFGWRDNKKFKMRNFKQLLMDIQHVPMRAQKVLLENNLNNWKGDLDQLDDIMVIGLQV